jgi:hypothetical protein
MAADELSPYILLLPLLALPLVVALLARRRALGRDDARLPPGPWAMPVIGHLHHVAGDAPPHRALRDLSRTYGPLMALRLRTVPVVVASSPAAAREVTGTHDAAFASRPAAPALRLLTGGAEGVTFAPYGDAWRRMRRACAAGLFSAPRVRSFRAVREDELGRLLRAVAAAASAPAPAPVNLTRRMSRFAFDSSARAVAGSRSEHRDEVLRALQDALKTLPKLSLLDFFPSSRLAALASHVPRVVARRRAAMRPIGPGLDAVVDSIVLEHLERRDSDVDDDEDLLDLLLRMQKDVDSQYPFTTLNIKSVIMVCILLLSPSIPSLLHRTFSHRRHTHTHRTCLLPVARRRRRPCSGQ